MGIRRSIICIALFGCVSSGWLATAAAVPGSGKATIAPANAAAGVRGTWTIEYVATEELRNGTVLFKIPPGWTPPQNVDSFSPGYVSVTSDAPTARPWITVDGSNIRVVVDAVPPGNKITLVYHNATPPATEQFGVEFTVESDPTGTTLGPITDPPSLDVMAGPVHHIDVTPPVVTTWAGSTLVFTIEVLDGNNERTALIEDRSFNLDSAPQALAGEIALAPQDNPGQFFLPDDPSTPIETLTIPSGRDTFVVWYRNTDANGGDPHRIYVASNDGLPPLLVDYADVTVNPVDASPSASSVVAEPASVVADGVTSSTVTVTVVDPYGNPKADVDVAFETTGSPTLGAVSQTDENGVTTVTVTNTTAEIVTISAVVGEIPLADTLQIEFTPGEPSGTITAAASPPNITANGISTSKITTSEPIVDAFDNVVAEGTVISVSTTAGTFLSEPDSMHISCETDSLGNIAFYLRSGTRPTTADIFMENETGSATGRVYVMFEPEPGFVDVGFPAPDVVEPGNSVAFQVTVEDTSATACTLLTSTTIRFGTFVDTLAAEVTVGGGSQVTLSFAGAVIDSDLSPRQYEPQLTLVGVDDFGSPYEETLQLGEIVVSGVELQLLTVKPRELSIGREHSFTVEVSNNGVTPVTLDANTTVEITQDTTTYSAALAQNTAIAAGSVPVPLAFLPETVSTNFSAGAANVTLYLQGTELGKPFAEALGAGSISLESRAEMIDSISVYPTLVTKDTNARFSVDVANAGSAEVHLDPDSTRFRFPGYDAWLERGSDDTIAGNTTTTLVFEATVVDVEPSDYYPEIELVGTENGLPFRDTISSLDSVTVQAAAVVRIDSIKANPNKVTAGEIPGSMIVSMHVSNTGEAAVVVDTANISFILAGMDYTNDFNTTIATGLDSLKSNSSGTIEFSVADADTNTTPGQYTIVGELAVTPIGGGESFTIISHAGYLNVQSKGVLEIVDVAAKPPTVTEGQEDWVINVVLANAGESAIVIRADSCSLSVDPGDGWDYIVLTSDTTLYQGKSAVLQFQMNSTAASGTYLITPYVTARDANSGRLLAPQSSVSGSVTVQTKADLSVVVRTSRDKVTAGSQQPWVVYVDVRNAGESTAKVDFESDSTVVDFPNADTPFDVRHPTAFVGGGTEVSYNETKTIEFWIEGTEDVTPLGETQINAFVDWEEINTKSSTVSSDRDFVTVQKTPDPLYDWMTPTAVTVGKSASFKVIVVESPGTSDLILDRDKTRLTFDFGEDVIRQTALSIASPDTISAASTDTLAFQNMVIDAAFSNPPVAPTLQIVGVENGNPFNSVPIELDTVGVSQPMSVTANLFTFRSTVSSGQTKTWKVGMEVAANGSSDVIFDPETTRLEFFVGHIGDQTSEFVAPLVDSTFAQSGSDTLFHDNSPDTLLFEVRQTGVATGPLEIRGHFGGWDFVNDEVVTDVASLYEMVVQKPGSLLVTSIRPERATVTAGQETDWKIVVDFKNVGEAAVRPKFGDETPTVRSDPPGVFEWTLPGYLESRDTLLLGGSIGGPADSLVFWCDNTLGPVGDIPLHFLIEGWDTNSVEPVSIDTEIAGIPPGIVTVQNPPKLRIVRTDAITPFSGRVNLGQKFPVVVEVENVADAPAAGAVAVVVELTSAGNSISDPVELTIDSIPAGTSAVDTFFVTAAGEVGPATLTARVIDAQDDNAGEQLWEPSSDIDAEAEVEIYHPSTLVVESVIANPDTVTRGQTKQWHVNVTVRNVCESSCASLDVMPPSNSDVSFWDGDEQVVGFEVSSPETFLGRPSLHLDPSDEDILQYTVLATSNNHTGVLSIRVGENWIDAHDHETHFTEGSGSAYVVNPSGLFIDSTYVDSTTAPNQPQGNLVLINSGRSFRVRVNVANAGVDVEDVDSVQVSLKNRNTVDPISLTSDYQRITKGDDKTFTFDVDLAELATDEHSRVEDLFASITHAVSTTTGEDVGWSAADPEETIIVQQPASLGVTLRVADPLDASTVSTNQRFTLAARVDNHGVAEVKGPGKLALTMPPNFTLTGSTPDIVAFEVGETINWDIYAPDAEVFSQILNVKITEKPIDRNTNESAAVIADSAGVDVDVVQGAAFVSPEIEIISPSGAEDLTVSTGQQFVIQGSVGAERTTVDITATLSVLGEARFAVIDPIIQSLGDGGDGRLSATWRVNAPLEEHTGGFEIHFVGRDINTGEDVGATTKVMSVRVVEEAKLELQAFITSPEAQDGIVSEGAPFTVKAVVVNNGEASVDTTTLKPRVSLVPPDGYEVSPAGRRPFTVDSPDSLVWNLRAPSNSTIVDLINVQIRSVPADSNTGEAATVTNDKVIIPIRTGDELITVDNVTQGLGVRQEVVPRGARDIALLGIEIANPRDKADPASVDTVLVSLLDKRGRSVTNPSGTLSELRVVVGANEFFGDVKQEPIMVIMENVRLPAESADTLTFMVSLSDHAELDEFSISIENGDAIVVTNTISKKSVPVADKTTLRSLVDRLRSRALVILSNNPHEYAHNYPNPFRAGDQETHIAYVVNKPGPVMVKIFDISGKLVYRRRYHTGEPGAGMGPQEVTWSGRNDDGEIVRNGIYICRIDTATGSVKIKIAVAK